MRSYVVIDSTCGNVESKFSWRDDREIPADYPMGKEEQIITLHDAEGESLDVSESCYNPKTKTFGPKLRLTSDVTQFNHLRGSATLTLTYPVNSVDETCHLSLGEASVPVNIVKGVGTFTFTSQITGRHVLTARSGSFYGKNTVRVEVV